MRCCLLNRPRKVLCRCHRAGKWPTVLDYRDGCFCALVQGPLVWLGPGQFIHPLVPQGLPRAVLLPTMSPQASWEEKPLFTPSGCFCLVFTRQDFALHFALEWEFRSYFVARRINISWTFLDFQYHRRLCGITPVVSFLFMAVA